MTTTVRLDKYLVDAGCASSRTFSVSMIRKGRVQIDGETIRSGKLKIDPYTAVISVDGTRIEKEEVPLLCVYHKPIGVHSTLSDTQGRADLFSEVLCTTPKAWQRSLHPVGRLDQDTSGLLLFSSSGDLTHRLLHPRHKVEKQYLAECRLRHEACQNTKDAETYLTTHLESGVSTATGSHKAKLVSFEVINQGESDDLFIRLRLIVSEGKHRMVRRMLANLGAPVLRLHRERFGLIDLDLPSGKIEPLRDPTALEWAHSLLRPPSPTSVFDTEIKNSLK